MSNQSTMNNGTPSSYERKIDLKAFDDRKSGVKGLVDEGAKKVPSIFVRPWEDRSKDFTTSQENLSVPVIDLAQVKERNSSSMEELVKEILWASETWGFFQVVNHGIPLEVLDNMIEGTRMFHEQDVEIKKEFYSRDRSKKVSYNTNYDFYKTKAASWRDSLYINTLFTGALDPHELPPIFRNAIMDYISHMTKLGDTLLELLSEALGLKSDHFLEMQCTRAWNLVCNYYPACPEPDLTLGASKHSDPSFLTILLQDQIGGLQVLHNDQWVNVEPLPGALIINIGDILQLISNDKLRSVYHRVIANKVGPRISIPFFISGFFQSPKLYGPIKELTSTENPPIYKEFTLAELFTYFFSRPLNQPRFEHFRLQNAENGN